MITGQNRHSTAFKRYMRLMASLTNVRMSLGMYSILSARRWWSLAQASPFFSHRAGHECSILTFHRYQK